MCAFVVSHVVRTEICSNRRFVYACTHSGKHTCENIICGHMQKNWAKRERVGETWWVSDRGRWEILIISSLMLQSLLITVCPPLLLSPSFASEPPINYGCLLEKGQYSASQINSAAGDIKETQTKSADLRSGRAGVPRSRCSGQLNLEWSLSRSSTLRLCGRSQNRGSTWVFCICGSQIPLNVEAESGTATTET